METTVFEIELKDGRIFRVFCANSTQKKRVLSTIDKIKHLKPTIKAITNGIHTVSEWEQITKLFTKLFKTIPT